VILEDFLEIRESICSRKPWVVAKESENIQSENAELKRKGVKCNIFVSGASRQV
jgi:hypothetical protein